MTKEEEVGLNLHIGRIKKEEHDAHETMLRKFADAGRK